MSGKVIYRPTQALFGSGESELRAYPEAHIPAKQVTVVPTAVQLKQLAPQPDNHQHNDCNDMLSKTSLVK